MLVEKETSIMKKDFSLKKYLEVQLVEVHKHKWILSEKAGHDVGFKDAFHDWVEHYGEEFHDFWFGERK